MGLLPDRGRVDACESPMVSEEDSLESPGLGDKKTYVTEVTGGGG